MDGLPITLRQLEIFAAVASEEHVTRAAERLFLTQSAVSTALRVLESELGGALFDRVGRQIRLNERGRRLQVDAAALLEQGRELVLASQSEDAVAGRLRVGASSTIGVYLLPRLIGEFAVAYPQVDVELEVGNSEQIERQLADNRLDLAFIEGPPHRDELEALPFLEDELVVFCSSQHALAGSGAKSGAGSARLGKRAAKQADWIMRESGSGTREVFEYAIREHVPSLRPRLVFGHTEAVKQAVDAGLGLGCLSRLTIARGLEWGAFVELKVSWLDLRRPLWLLTRRDTFEGRARRAFLELVSRGVS